MVYDPVVTMRKVGERDYDFESRRAQRLYKLRPDGDHWKLEEHDIAEGGSGHVETIGSVTFVGAVEAVFAMAHDTIFYPEQ